MPAILFPILLEKRFIGALGAPSMNLALKITDRAHKVVVPNVPKILIVDDESRMCDSLEALLSTQGYEIHTANGGKRAIEHLAKNDFDLVLLDIVMPEMSGNQVMHYINNQDLETLIVIMTGHASVESALEAMRSGVYDYLRKPFEHEELLKTVENALDQKRLKSERRQAEEALKKAHEKSEQRVEERTAELTKANEQLKQEIEERKRAEEQIRRLNHQLLLAQENVRQRISYELHDVVGQELSALMIGLDTFFDNQPEAPPEMRQRLYELSKIVRGAIAAVRNLSHTLRSTGLDRRGLVPAVLRYCEEFFDKNRVKVDFFAAGIDESKLDFHTKINLYRVIQESLNNVKKHARASSVTVRLVGSFPNIILGIEDDGKGFDVQNRMLSGTSEKHMGLRIMEERVALLNGKMRVESRPKQGTKLFVEVPYKGTINGQKKRS
ncbi:MAG: response regulator [Desulfobacterales bacterium]|nr:response regulator [Desulfobacterales bacterium]